MPRNPVTNKTITSEVLTLNGEETTVWTASHGDNEGPFTGQLEQCYACGLTFPKDEVSYWRTHPYCEDCKSDIPRLIEREHGTRDQPSGREEIQEEF